jgi:hypothetical protein
MGLLAEFKEFAMKGNVIDLAVGIVIGTAFGKIVSSLVEDVVMPPIGLAVGGVNFNDLAVGGGGAPPRGPGGVQIRRVSADALRVPDHRVCNLHARQGHQSPEASAGGRERTGTGAEPHRDAARGDPQSSRAAVAA